MFHFCVSLVDNKYSWDQVTSSICVFQVRLYRALQCMFKFQWFNWEAAPVLMIVVSFAIFTANGGILTAQKAFVSLQLFYKLRLPIQRIPPVLVE